MLIQYTYLLLNVFIIFFPFIFSFEPRIQFYKKWKRLFWSALPVSLGFIIWDMIVTSRGHWTFNPSYTTGIKVINLPIEEILFFITVPYSCLFLYELIKSLPLAISQQSLVKKKVVPKIYAQVGVFFGVVIYIATVGRLVDNGKEYTAIVLIMTTLVTLVLYSEKQLFNRTFLLWMGVCFILFFITNTILTSLPVVSYGTEFITNIRVGTIPIEDFLYNWSLLGLYLWQWQKKLK